VGGLVRGKRKDRTMATPTYVLWQDVWEDDQGRYDGLKSLVSSRPLAVLSSHDRAIQCAKKAYNVRPDEWHKTVDTDQWAAEIGDLTFWIQPFALDWEPPQ
jgi:hypothetical protein